jgi:hypothetical protein
MNKYSNSQRVIFYSPHNFLKQDNYDSQIKNQILVGPKTQNEHLKLLYKY